jgi:MFS transporter, DHA1 family, tetracycline resistance protein
MRKALITVFLIVFIDLVGFGIFLPNQQYYGQTFGITNVFYLTLLGPAYSIFQFIFAPIFGKWSDRAGRRRVLIVSQCGTLVGYAILFLAHFVIEPSQPLAIFLLYFSRVLAGTTGGNISVAVAYIADIMPPEKRAKGMGIIGAAFGLGFIFGPFIGGVVGKHLGLQFVPVAAACFSIAALAGTIFFLKESLTPDRRAPATRQSYATVFHAILDRLFGIRHALLRPTIGMLIWIFFVNGFAFAGMEQTFSLLIQERAHLSVENASGASGYLFGSIGVLIVIFQGGLIGPLTRQFGERLLVQTGPILTAAGLALVGVAGHHGLPVWTTLAIGAALLAVGSSLFNPSMQGLISRHATGSEQGEIMGAAQGMASLARAIGPLLAGALYAHYFSGMPYFVSAAICFAVALWSLGMGHRLQPPPLSEALPGLPVEAAK